MKKIKNLFLMSIISTLMLVLMPLNAMAESNLSITYDLKDNSVVFKANYSGDNSDKVFFVWSVVSGGSYNSDNLSEGNAQYYTHYFNDPRVAVKVSVKADIGGNTVVANATSSEVRLKTDAQLFNKSLLKPIELNYSDDEEKINQKYATMINDLKSADTYITDVNITKVNPKTVNDNKVGGTIRFKDGSDLNVEFPLTVIRNNVSLSFQKGDENINTLPENKTVPIGTKWHVIEAEAINQTNVKSGFELGSFEIDGVAISDHHIFEKDTVITVKTVAKKYEVTITTKPDINDSIQVYKSVTNEEVNKIGDKYLLTKGDYYLKATKEPYKDYTKGFTVEDKNINVEWNLPNVKNIVFKKASGIEVKKSQIVGSEAEIFSDNARFESWIIEGLTLSEEQLKSNPIKFVMPDNDVVLSEKLRDYTGTSPKIDKDTFEYNKAVDNELVLPVDFGSEELKATAISYIEHNGEVLNTGYFTLSGNNLTFTREYMQLFDTGNKVLKIKFNDPKNTEISININVINAVPHKVSVVNGTADVANQIAGKKVEIEAVAQPKKIFVGWESNDNVVFENPKSLKTNFVMPDKDVSVIAKFEDIKNKLTVIKGNTAEVKDVKIDEAVNISSTADNFKRWEISGYALSNPADYTNKNIQIIMPNTAVTIKEILSFKVKVNVNQADAKVEIIKSDNTVINGNDFTLDTGTYTLQVSKNGFETYRQTFSIVNKDVVLNVNLQKKQANVVNNTQKENKPIVKKTCADEGKVWDEAKKMCVALTTPKPTIKQTPNSSAININKDTKETNKEVKTNKTTETPKPTSTPEVKETVKPEVSATPTPTSTPEESKPEVKTEKKSDSVIPYVVGGTVGISLLGLIIFILIRKFGGN